MAEKVYVSGKDEGSTVVAQKLFMIPITVLGDRETAPTYDEENIVLWEAVTKLKYESTTNSATLATTGGTISSVVIGDGTLVIDKLGLSQEVMQILFSGIEELEEGGIGITGANIVPKQIGLSTISTTTDGKYFVKTVPLCKLPFSNTYTSTASDGSQSVVPETSSVTVNIEKAPGAQASYEVTFDTYAEAEAFAKKMVGTKKVVTP